MTPEPYARETLPQLIRSALAPPDRTALMQRGETGWEGVTAGQLLARVERLARAIRASGLVSGDRVALMAHDCVDWIVADFATLFAGCVVVPIYPTQAADQVAYILQHAGVRLIFADTRPTLARLRSGGAPEIPVVVFDSPGDDGLAAFEAGGASPGDLPMTRESTLSPDDLAVLIYTSGTTGAPKGVMLSHDNIAFDARASLQYALHDLTEGTDVLSVLPYSHIFEHTILYVYLLARTRCFICQDPSQLPADLVDARPAVMTAVPRIFDRVLAGLTGAAMQAGGLRGRLMAWSLKTGRRYARARTFEGRAGVTLALQYAVARRLVLDRMRARLGLDRLRFFVSGSAALHVDTAMTFLGMGLPIMQGYGLTETSPVVTTSRPDANEYGASGRPIPGVDVAIAPDGEILTRGRHVMLGYYRDAEATAAAIVDGWLHTGDVGTIDGAGFLRITDRKREVFKTDTGKWVSPARIESALKRSAFVAAVLVVGDGRPHPAALICPNWPLVRLELRLPEQATAEELARRDDVRAFFMRLARRQTRELASFEQVRRTVVIPNEFSVENGELSPSMKIKRRIVEGRYAGEIDAAYAADLHAREAAAV